MGPENCRNGLERGLPLRFKALGQLLLNRFFDSSTPSRWRRKKGRGGELEGKILAANIIAIQPPECRRTEMPHARANLYRTFSILVIYYLMTCSWLILDLFICSLLCHKLFTNISFEQYFFTCSPFFQDLFRPYLRLIKLKPGDKCHGCHLPCPVW